MLRPIRSTREASASRAIGKPVPPSWRARSWAIAAAGASTGQSHSAGSGTSAATTSAAPRRSIAKAQKPSNVPTSRQRCPPSEAGRPTLSGMSRRSNQPGVTTPGASSSVWYQSRAATRSASAALIAAPAPRCRRRRAAA